MMGSLPTCWYCPECGNVSNIKPPGAHLNARTWLQCSGVHVESLVFPPDSPLSVILDTLGIEYREGWENRGPGVDPFIAFMGQTDKPVLVVDNPATGRGALDADREKLITALKQVSDLAADAIRGAWAEYQLEHGDDEFTVEAHDG